MKTELNQDIRSTGILTVIGLLVVCAMAASPLWSGQSTEEKEILMRHAESLAYQIIEIQRAKVVAKTEGRAPASASDSEDLQGQIGMDPWGHPFHFKIVEQKNSRRVFVWSLGPNAKVETRVSSLDSSRDVFDVGPVDKNLGVSVDFK